MYVSRALRKYGPENFSFEILEYCEVKDLMAREGHYLNLFKEQNASLYNLSTDPTAPMAGRSHSPESVQLMSEAHLSRYQKGETNAFFAKKHSEESLEIMRKAKYGDNNPMFGKNHSAETREKISAARLGQRSPKGAGRPCQAIEVFDIENNLTTSYDSINAAASALGISPDSIRSTFRKNRQKPYKKRYIFKKID